MPTRSVQRAAAGAAAVAIACTLAGCGSAATTGGSTPTGTPSATTGSSGHTGRYAGRGFRPGVSGVISSVSRRSMWVSSTTGKTSEVTWTSSTNIAEEEPATASVLAKGACVSIRPTGFGGRGTAGPSSSPTGRSHAAGGFTGPVTAGTVTALPAAGCSSRHATAGGFGFGLTGSITATDSGSFTVTTVIRARPSGSASPTATPSRSRAAAPRTLTVHTTASTTYLRQRAGGDASVQAGLCVLAVGKASGSTLAARALTISQSVNGSCSSGFGGAGSGGGSSA